MDVEKLTVDLRPRPHWQALDLGFALLRSRAGSVYAAWWSIWSGIVVVACLGAALQPKWMWFWILLPWWSRPAVERMVVHILSRGVFGETVTWKQAIRAWPSTWGGGLVRALTWWRAWALGRSFLQPTWQLEGARGEVASRRREVLSRKGAGKTAFYWGLVCVHMEFVLWIALLAFAGLFVPQGQEGNPFLFVLLAIGSDSDSIHAVAGTLTYGLVLGFVGPFYAACGFTLYLNRRAELEAWDIELSLRGLARRKSSNTIRHRILPVVLAILVLAGNALSQDDSCQPPEHWRDPAKLRTATSDPKRIALRRQVDSIFRSEPILRQWTCKETWVRKDTTSAKPEEGGFAKELFEALGLIGRVLTRGADWIRWALIAAAVGFVAWIAWKYRDMVDFGSNPRRGPNPELPATHARHSSKEEELEPDPTDSAMSLWNQGLHRAALAVLYRHACRFAQERGARIRKGDSEGAVARAVSQIHRDRKIDATQTALLEDTVEIWSRAAWAGVRPDTDSVRSLCDRWRAESRERVSP